MTDALRTPAAAEVAAAELDVAVEVLSASASVGAASTHAERRFSRVDLAVGAGCEHPRYRGCRRLSLFIKSAPVARLPTGADDYLNGKPVPVPYFFGAMEAAGEKIAVWEFREGVQAPPLASCTDAQLTAILRALAEVEARTTRVRDELPHLHRIPWARPVYDGVREALAGLPGLAQERKLLEGLREIEPVALAILTDEAQATLTHCDLKPPNIILEPEGEALLVDWTSAAVGVPGASLRKFALVDSGLARHAAEIYAGFMADGGTPVEPQRVLFTLRAQHVFHTLRWGVRLNDKTRIRSGLLAVPALSADCVEGIA